jgi:WD repeat-containing protein 35
MLALLCQGTQANSAGRQISAVQFYSPHGQLLRSLRVPGNGIKSIAWEGSGTRIALAVDSFIYFADIRPQYQWSFFDDVLVYAFDKPGKDEKCVAFWNTKSNERFAKYVHGLIDICAFGDLCVLITEAAMKNMFALIICDAKGAALTSSYVEVRHVDVFVICFSRVDCISFKEKPLFCVMTASHLITATDSHVNLWDYSASECKKIVNLQIIRQNDSIREPIDAGVDPGSGHLKPEFR